MLEKNNQHSLHGQTFFFMEFLPRPSSRSKLAEASKPNSIPLLLHVRYVVMNTCNPFRTATLRNDRLLCVLGIALSEGILTSFGAFGGSFPLLPQRLLGQLEEVWRVDQYSADAISASKLRD